VDLGSKSQTNGIKNRKGEKQKDTKAGWRSSAKWGMGGKHGGESTDGIATKLRGGVQEVGRFKLRKKRTGQVGQKSKTEGGEKIKSKSGGASRGRESEAE